MKHWTFPLFIYIRVKCCKYSYFQRFSPFDFDKNKNGNELLVMTLKNPNKKQCKCYIQDSVPSANCFVLVKYVVKIFCFPRQINMWNFRLQLPLALQVDMPSTDYNVFFLFYVNDEQCLSHFCSILGFFIVLV